MPYEDYLKNKEDRDERLWQHHKAHPEMSQRALAKQFRISQARVSEILKRKAGEKEPTASKDTPPEAHQSH